MSKNDPGMNGILALTGLVVLAYLLIMMAIVIGQELARRLGNWVIRHEDQRRKP